MIEQGMPTRRLNYRTLAIEKIYQTTREPYFYIDPSLIQVTMDCFLEDVHFQQEVIQGREMAWGELLQESVVLVQQSFLMTVQ